MNPFARRTLVLMLAASAAAVTAACDIVPSWESSGYRPAVRRAATPAPQTGPGGTITARSGDTVYTLARQYNVGVRELIEANNLSPPYQLPAGKILLLPSAARDYVVQRGDTLSSIARRHNVDASALARANNLAPPYTVRLDQHLTIPSSVVPGPVIESETNTVVVYRSPWANGAASPAPAPAAASSAPRIVAEPLAAPPPRAAPATATVLGSPAVEPEPIQTALTTAAGPPVPSPPPLTGHGFIWPLKGEVIAEYGPTGKGQTNDGLNIAAAKGTTVVATEDGVVAYAGNELRGFGNLLLVKHADNWMSAYAHNDELLVKRGEKVKRGQAIAKLGATGNVKTPQLHFELRKGSQVVNPQQYLPQTMSAVGVRAGDRG